MTVEYEIPIRARAGRLGENSEVDGRGGGTNPDGTCTIEFPRVLPKEIYVTARKPGFARRSYGPLLEPGEAGIASDHTIEMESGVTIGGVVKNCTTAGRRHRCATVIIRARAGADRLAGLEAWVSAAKVTTDTQGSAAAMARCPPAGGIVYITVTHLRLRPDIHNATSEILDPERSDAQGEEGRDDSWMKGWLRQWGGWST